MWQASWEYGHGPRSKRGVAFVSNGQSKCFDRMQLGIQLLHIRLLYQPNADDTSQMHQLHSELMRRSAFRVRLPGRTPAVGPPCHITQSASQGTSTGCDRAQTVTASSHTFCE